MPPFRVVVRSPDEKSPNHPWHAVGPVFDAREDVDEALAAAGENPAGLVEVAPESLPPEQRVRVTFADRLAELRALGYEEKVQELVVKAEAPDDAGSTVPVEHKWKDA